MMSVNQAISTVPSHRKPQRAIVLALFAIFMPMITSAVVSPFGSSIALAGILVGFYIGIIPLAMNWRQLGKNQWVIPTILIALILCLGDLLFFGLYFIPRGFDINTQLVPLITNFLFSLHLGFVISLTVLQRVPYNKWAKDKDTIGMLSHPYKLSTAVMSMAFVIIFFLSLGGISVLLTKPETFEANSFSVTYLGWQSKEEFKENSCPIDYQCILSLERSKRPSLSITFLEKTLSSQATLESIVQNHWEDISVGINSTLKSQKVINIDDQTGIAIEYRAELKNFPNAYYMEIMIINNQDLLNIIIFAKDKKTFDIGFDKIEEVLSQVEIK